MLPLTGILRPSTVGTPQQKSRKPQSRVSWGQLQVQAEGGEVTTEAIPEVSSAERDKLHQVAQQTYFGDEIDLTGLESSRRRRRVTSIGFEETTSGSSSRQSSGDEESPAHGNQKVYKMSLSPSSTSKKSSVDVWVFDLLENPHPMLVAEGVDTSDIILKKRGFQRGTKRLTQKTIKAKSDSFLLSSVNVHRKKHQYLLKYSRVGKLFVNNLGDPGVLKLLNEFNHLESEANRSKLVKLSDLGVGLLFDNSGLASSTEKQPDITSSDKPYSPSKHAHPSDMIQSKSLYKQPTFESSDLACKLADAQLRKEKTRKPFGAGSFVEPDSATMSLASIGSPGGKSFTSEMSSFPISRFGGGATENELMSPTTPGPRASTTKGPLTLNKKYSIATPPEKSHSRKRRCISFDVGGLHEARESVIKRFKILQWRAVCERTEEVVIVFNECVTLKLRISIRDRDWTAGREVWVVEQIEYRIFSGDNNLHSLMSAAIDYIQKSYESLDLLNFLSLLFIIHHDLSRFYRQIRTRIDSAVRIDKKGRAKLKLNEVLDMTINLFTNEIAIEGATLDNPASANAIKSLVNDQPNRQFGSPPAVSQIENFRTKMKSTSASNSPTNANTLRLPTTDFKSGNKPKLTTEQSFELIKPADIASGKIPKHFQARLIDVCHATFGFLRRCFNSTEVIPVNEKKEGKSDSNSTTIREDSGANSAREHTALAFPVLPDRKFSEIQQPTKTQVEISDVPDPGFMVQRRKRTATRDTPEDLGLPN